LVCFSAFKRYVCTQWELRKFHKNNMTVADIFQTVAAKNPDGISIIFEDAKWTFQQVNEESLPTGYAERM